jgi:ribosomal protein L30E
MKRKHDHSFSVQNTNAYKKTPSTTTPLRRKMPAAESANKRTPNRGQRIMKATEKDEVVKRINDAFQAGAKVGYGQAFFVGVNSISRQLEENMVSIIGIVRDSRPILHDHIAEAAALRNVPVRYLPRCSAELGQAFKIHRVSCFALSRGLEAQSTSDGASDGASSQAISSNEQIQVVLDSIYEMLVATNMSS